jgi:hypothetical protein
MSKKSSSRYTIWPEAVPASWLRQHWCWAEKRFLLESEFGHLPDCQRRMTSQLVDDIFADLALKVLPKRMRYSNNQIRKFVNQGP